MSETITTGNLVQTVDVDEFRRALENNPSLEAFNATVMEIDRIIAGCDISGMGAMEAGVVKVRIFELMRALVNRMSQLQPSENADTELLTLFDFVRGYFSRFPKVPTIDSM